MKELRNKAITALLAIAVIYLGITLLHEKELNKEQKKELIREIQIQDSLNTEKQKNLELNQRINEVNMKISVTADKLETTKKNTNEVPKKYKKSADNISSLSNDSTVILFTENLRSTDSLLREVKFSEFFGPK